METRQESVVCPGCGCLCDDLDLTLEDGRIVAVNNVCLWGVSRFIQSKKFHPKKDRRRLSTPQVRRQGRWQEVSYDAALEEAAAILTRARRPVIYGLTNVGSWAQEAALHLARGLGARLEPADLGLMAPYYRSLARHGVFWAPLEVIRDEADTVLFWGANPLHSNPRHVVRYAVFARGRFTERGIEDRRVAAVDLYGTELAKFCRPFIAIEPGQELDLARGVAALLEGEPLDSPRIKGTGRLAEFMGQADFGVIFAGRGLGYQAPKLWDLLSGMVARLNTRRRWALFPLSGDFNASGLYHLLLSQLGSAAAPDFGGIGGLTTHATPVDFREVDAVLVAGADFLWFLPGEQVQDLKERQVPLVVLSPYANRTTAQAQVVLPVALAGVETMEVAYRMDGLPLVLRPVLPASLPPDHEVLGALCGLAGEGKSITS